MAISEEAQRNHDELFPNHTSTLKVTWQRIWQRGMSDRC